MVRASLIAVLLVAAAPAPARSAAVPRSKKIHVLPPSGAPFPSNGAVIVDTGPLTGTQVARFASELLLDCRDKPIRFRRVRVPPGFPATHLVLVPNREPKPASWCDLRAPAWSQRHLAREHVTWRVNVAMARAVWADPPSVDTRLRRANDYTIRGVPIVAPLEGGTLPYVFATLRDRAGKPLFSGILEVTDGRAQLDPGGTCRAGSCPGPGSYELELTTLGPRGVWVPAATQRLAFTLPESRDPRQQRPELEPPPESTLGTSALLAITGPSSQRAALESLANGQLTLVAKRERVPVRPMTPVIGEHAIRVLISASGLSPDTEYTLHDRSGPVRVGGRIARWRTAGTTVAMATTGPVATPAAVRFSPRLELDGDTDQLRIKAPGAPDGAYVRLSLSEPNRFEALVPVRDGVGVVDERWFPMAADQPLVGTLVLIGLDGRELGRAEVSAAH